MFAVQQKIDFFLYGYNITHRETCVICGYKPPCLIGTNCQPNGIEGNLLAFVFGKK